MTVKDKATRLCALIGICSLGIYLAACNYGELPVDGEGTEKVELRFSASISDSPSTKAGQPSHPTITPVDAFKTGKHEFGLFVTRENGTALTTGSDDNMKSTLNVGSDPAWTHADKTGKNPISLAVNNGENILIKGYYPWTAGTDEHPVTAAAVPFDLSSTDPTKWIDLLYLSSPAPTDPQKITDVSSTITLQFSHAFCWVTINLLQLSLNNMVKVKAVTIGNAYTGQGTICNKGTLDLNTGKIKGVSGPLKIEMKDPITLDTKDEATAQPSVFNFLVPPVMSPDIKNSDIVIEVTTVESAGPSAPEEEKVLTFPLSLSHLNNEGNNYGFAKGKHNTYDLVYNNSSMNLSLSDWQTATITDNKLGEGTANVTPKKITFQNIWLLEQDVKPNILATSNHLLHTYLGEVAEDNNGSYETIPFISSDDSKNVWRTAVQVEPFQQLIMGAQSLAAGGAQIAWKDEVTGALLAKQACVEFREGGYTDWRLPRICECHMLDYPAQLLGGKESWSATEASLTESYAIVVVHEGDKGQKTFGPKMFSKQELFYVRCVRDFEKDKPTK